MAKILFPLRTGPDRARIVSPWKYSQRDATTTSRFVYWNHTRRPPCAQQKRRNSRTAYHFSTDHRSREYLLEIFRSLSLSFSLSLSLSLSLSVSISPFLYPSLFLPLAPSKDLHFYCHSAWKRADTAAYCIAYNLYLLVPLRWTLRCKHSLASRSRRYKRDISLIHRVIWRISRLWPIGAEHDAEPSADLCYIYKYVPVSLSVFSSR